MSWRKPDHHCVDCGDGADQCYEDDWLCDECVEKRMKLKEKINDKMKISKKGDKSQCTLLEWIS